MALAARLLSIAHPVVCEQESTESLRLQVSADLRRVPKSISPRWLFDERGSALFDRLCSVPEYYLARSELALVDRHASTIAGRLGPDVVLIEFGSGTSLKARVLLDELAAPFAYVPVDLSRTQLISASRALAVRFPDLRVLPVCADFTRSFVLPVDAQSDRRRLVYLAGATLCGFDPQARLELLRLMHLVVGPDGAVLVSIDLRKDVQLIESAYNDLAGVTARFNRNVLAHLNNRFDATFDVYSFRHEAVWLPQAGCVEMRLRSQVDQSAQLGPEKIEFRAGEPVITARGYKPREEEFEELVEKAGMGIGARWVDHQWSYALYWLESPPAPGI